MAVAIIEPTGIAVSDWTLVNCPNAIAGLTDADPFSGVSNYPATTPHLIRMFSTGTKPANMVGATITAVHVYLGASATFPWGNNSGDRTVQINGTNYGTFSTYPWTGGLFDVTGFKSWTDADFYVASTTWGLRTNGNADAANRTSLLNRCYLQVTYTPATAPTAQFTVSTTTGTSPLTVTFTDQSSNSPTSWFWQFGDTETSTVQNPVHIYSSTATVTYTVTLTATNGGGSDDETKSSLLTVDPSVADAVAAFTATPVSGVQNLGVQFNDQSTGTPAPNSWIWNFGDGSATTTEQNPLHVYTTVGVYTVTLTAANATPTTDSEVKTSYITVLDGKPVPLAEASTTTGTRPLTVEFTGSATNALPTSWFWQFGDGVESVAQSPTHVYNTVGVFTPQLTVANEIGSATDTVGPITVEFATPTAAFTAAPLMGYIPLTVRFTDESTGDVNSWGWNFGDTEISSEQHPVHVYRTNNAAAGLTVTQTGFSDDYDLRFGLNNYWKLEEATGAGDRVAFIGGLNLVPDGSLTQITGKENFGVEIATNRILQKLTGFTDTGDFSAAFWVKFPTITDTTFLLSLTSAWAIQKDVDHLQLAGISGSTIFAADTWYHLVVTADITAGIVRMYVNGVLDLTTPVFAIGPIDQVKLGSGAAAEAFYVDELAIYAHKLEQDQITGLYNLGDGRFFNVVSTSDSETFPAGICPITPNLTWGYFFEELKFQLMEPMHELDVCTGFDAFGGMAKAVELAQNRLKRFVLETAALRKEATLSAATAGTEDFALPTDLIELLRIEVDGVPYYPADPMQRDFDSGALNTYFQKDALSITIPGTFGTTPVVKAFYTYMEAAPSVPSPCTCPTPPGTGPWTTTVPLPYVLWWIIRYGVMADMFSQAGERNDPLRAAKCEEMFAFGTQLYKFLYRGGSGS